MESHTISFVRIQRHYLIYFSSEEEDPPSENSDGDKEDGNGS